MKDCRSKTATDLVPSTCDGLGQFSVTASSVVSADVRGSSLVLSNARPMSHVDQESVTEENRLALDRSPRNPFRLQIASLIPDFCRELQIIRAIASTRDDAKRLAENLFRNLTRAGMASAGCRLRNYANLYSTKKAVLNITVALTLSSTLASNGGNTPLHNATYASGFCRLVDSSAENISDLKSGSYQFPIPQVPNPAPACDWTLHLKTCPKKGRESARMPFLLVRNALAPRVLSPVWVSMVPHPDFRYRVSMPGGPRERRRRIPI